MKSNENIKTKTKTQQTQNCHPSPLIPENRPENDLPEGPWNRGYGVWNRGYGFWNRGVGVWDHDLLPPNGLESKPWGLTSGPSIWHNILTFSTLIDKIFDFIKNIYDFYKNQ